MDNFKITSHDFVSEKNCQLQDNYEIKESLGEGSFGSVRKVTHRLTHEDRAVKILHKKKLNNEENMKEIHNEVSILQKLDHPNILKVYECYQDKFCYCIVTELCSGGELFNKIANETRFSEAVAADYIRQILSCLVYCHEKQIVHRDLKPENFLLANNSPMANLKLIDFGSATYFSNGSFLNKKLGTVYYIAPEVIQQNYNEKCDIWSAGAILYMMLSGTPPFNGKNDSEILNCVAKGKYSLIGGVWDKINTGAKDLIRNMMNTNVSTRLTAKQSLNHPWLFTAIEHPIDRGKSSQLLSNLQSFHTEKKLQRAILSLIVSQIASKDEREEMLELFKKLDRDNNGTLSKQDLINGISLFNNITEREIDSIMNEVDVDKSGEIDYSEFVTAAINKNILLSSDKIMMAFNEFDISKSGGITVENMKAILAKDVACDDEVWTRIFKEVDKNGDGVIDLQEFSEMMRN